MSEHFANLHRTLPETLQAIDLMVREDDLFEMYCAPGS